MMVRYDLRTVFTVKSWPYQRVTARLTVSVYSLDVVDVLRRTMNAGTTHRPRELPSLEIAPGVYSQNPSGLCPFNVLA